jgi:hypothetical protein
VDRSREADQISRIALRALLLSSLLLALSVASSNETPAQAAVESLADLDIRVLDLAPKHIAYDETRDVFYLVMPGNAPSHRNEMVAIDETGAVQWSLFVGAGPHIIQLTEGATHAYIALERESSVKRVDLTARSIDQTIALPAAGFQIAAKDIAILPGRPESIAVVMGTRGTAGFEGVAVFDNGVMRPSVGRYPHEVNRIEAVTSDRVYGIEGETGRDEFVRLDLDANGVSATEAVAGISAAASFDLTYAAGRIYLSDGQVIDPEAEVVVGRFSLGGNRAVDPSSGHIFFTSRAGLSMHDLDTFVTLETRELPPADHNIWPVRWGTDGLAYINDDSMVILGDLDFASISGRILNSSGHPTTMGVAEIYDEQLNWFAEGISQSDGRYETVDLPPGRYFVLLYNGDTTTYYDYFPEWYADAPMRRLDRAQPVTISGTDLTGIDARLEPFFDDMWDSVFVGSIIFLRNVGLTQGCNPPSNTLFCPDSPVTRGQMAAFLVRAFEYPVYNGPDRFRDDNGHLFEDAIERLAQAGVTKGCNPPRNDRFCPDARVTRGEMAAFLVRAFGYTAGLGSDLFNDDDGSVFENAIDLLGTAGVTRGCNPPSNDRFCPRDPVTRGQMAAFLTRAIERTPLQIASMEREAARS